MVYILETGIMNDFGNITNVRIWIEDYRGEGVLL